MLPRFTVRVNAGVKSYRGEKLDYKILCTVLATVFIAELGDKTQLTTLLFAADEEVRQVTVFIGASLALIVASGIGVLAGSAISQYIGEKQLRYIVCRHRLYRHRPVDTKQDIERPTD